MPKVSVCEHGFPGGLCEKCTPVKSEINQHKSIAYTMKAAQEAERQANQKILRVLRAHEHRLYRIEKHLNLLISDSELVDLTLDEPKV